MADARGVYLDASALVKLVIEEAETPALRRYLADEPRLYSSRVGATEVRRAVSRQAEHDAVGQLEALLATVRIVEFDEPLSLAAGQAPPPSLRTLDAIHLASAVAVAEDLRAVIVYDRRLAGATVNAGLEVVTPA